MTREKITIGLGGDLMIGRTVDQYLEKHPPDYVWGSLKPTLLNTDLNLVNLETTLTRSVNRVPKVFNFRSNPKNVSSLKEGRIDVVNIANNHILDFSMEGLLETLQVLDLAKILHVGAGHNLSEAMASIIIEKKDIKIGILGCTDNEPFWKASENKPGIFFIDVGDVDALRDPITNLRKKVDLLILSIHWGPNMRKRPTDVFQSFAHDLIDLGVDILHGHSAHVFQGVEIYKGKLILYDTGELVDDYAVDPILRNDRSFFFIVTLEEAKLLSLKMMPIEISECQANVLHDLSILDEMEKLSKEFKTKLYRLEGSLIAYF